MKVAIYLRVSTDEQAREGYSIEAQKQRLEAYVTSQDWQVYKYYVDDGYSAKNLERPQVQQLISDCEKGLFDVVLVYKLDRLVRSVANLHELLKLFDKHGIKFRSATEVFETTSAMGRFFITLVGAMAEWERETISERVHFVMRQKVENEGKWMSGPGPYGYDAKNGILSINEEEAKWVRYVFERYKIEGKDMIADRLNKMGILSRGHLWTGSRINYLLKNPVYKGVLRYDYKTQDKRIKEDYVVIEDAHDPIVSKEEWNEAQRIMKDRYVFKGKGNKGKYPFSGVLVCHRCGKRLYGEQATIKGKYKYVHYKCGGRFRYKQCDLPIIRTELIEEKFLDLLTFPPVFAEEKPEIDTKRLQSELKRIESKIERLKDAYFDNLINKQEFTKRMQNEKEREEEILIELETSSAFSTEDELIEACHHLKDIWNDTTNEEKKMAIYSLVEQMTVDVTKEYDSGKYEQAEIEITDISFK